MFSKILRFNVLNIHGCADFAVDDISDDDPEEVSLIIIQIARLFELFHIHLVDLVYIFANLSSEALGKLGVKGPDVGGSCGGIVGISGVMFGEIAH